MPSRKYHAELTLVEGLGAIADQLDTLLLDLSGLQHPLAPELSDIIDKLQTQKMRLTDVRARLMPPGYDEPL